MKPAFRIEKEAKLIDGKARFTLRIFKASLKAAFFKEKIVVNYYFSSAEKRDSYHDEFMANEVRKEANKQARIESKRTMKANMVNPFKVGDIVYDSWGYDQTNIDFYQVIDCGKKSVKIQRIAERMIKDAGFLCEYVAPIKDDFIEGSVPETKILQVLNDGTVYINSRHGWISKWEEERNEKGIYQSHYA